jgi:imidazolonepropionase
MSILITNIKELVQVEESPVDKVCGKDMSVLNTIKNAWLLIEGDRIADFGSMNNANYEKDLEKIDASGCLVFPSFCDSHTHLVYAGSREMEYTDKIRGLSYEEIAKRGGGILNSARRLQESSEEELADQAMARLNEIMMLGTGAVADD